MAGEELWAPFLGRCGLALMVPPSLPSAGIGRTGTIIVIDMLMESISTKGEGCPGVQVVGWVGSSSCPPPPGPEVQLSSLLRAGL